MKKAGYTLHKCETDNDVKSFKKYYKAEEELCTFRDSTRINRNLIFFAVKDNVDSIERKNFLSPRRQDEYGTSVISLQFTKSEPNTLSIKNRYNHTVENSDATFSNDLENIIAGLTDSFVKKYNLNLVNEGKKFEIPGYVLANNGKFYKYNYEINNIYYCVNNIVVTQDRNAVEYDKSRYLVFDYFIMDMQDKTISLYDKSVGDSFVDVFKKNTNIHIKKENAEKIIRIVAEGVEDVFIKIDKQNRIIKYSNKNLTEAGNYFLYCNRQLTDLKLPNLKKAANNFLYNNSQLTHLNLPNLKNAGNYFLNLNRQLTKLNLPNLKNVGNSFLYDNSQLTTLNLPNLENIGNGFLYWSSQLTDLKLPNLKNVGNCFLYDNEQLTDLNLPKLENAGYEFLCNNEQLTILKLPKLVNAERDFLYDNRQLTDLTLPNLKNVEDYFLYNNEQLTDLTLPNLEKTGDGFLYNNRQLTDLNLPKLEKTGDGFLYNNRQLTDLKLPNLKNVENGFLSSHSNKSSFLANIGKGSNEEIGKGL